MEDFPVDVIALMLTHCDCDCIMAASCISKRWYAASQRECVKVALLRCFSCCNDAARMLGEAINTASVPLDLRKVMAAFSRGASPEWTSCRLAGVHSFVVFHTQFDSLPGVPPAVLRGIYAYGFAMPSSIQERVIAPLLVGLDVRAQAESGTGKTASYTIAGLSRLHLSDKHTQMLVVCPTRELSINVAYLIKGLGKYLPELRVTACDEKLPDGEHPHVIVSTPARLLDLNQRKTIDTSHVRFLVLDEAQDLISRDAEQIQSLCEFLPLATCQVAVFSPYSIDPVHHEIIMGVFPPHRKFLNLFPPHLGLGLQNVRNFYVSVEREEWKLDTLCDILQELEALSPLVIYCNTRRRVDWLVSELARRYPLLRFASTNDSWRNLDQDLLGNARAVITTDLYVPPMRQQRLRTHVLNFDLPNNVEVYLRRCGTYGRLAPTMLVTSFVTTDQVEKLREIERFYNITIEELPMNITDLI